MKANENSPTVCGNVCWAREILRGISVCLSFSVLTGIFSCENRLASTRVFPCRILLELRMMVVMTAVR